MNVLTTELRVIDSFSQTFNKASQWLKKLKSQFIDLNEMTFKGLDFKLDSGLSDIKDLTKWMMAVSYETKLLDMNLKKLSDIEFKPDNFNSLINFLRDLKDAMKQPEDNKTNNISYLADLVNVLNNLDMINFDGYKITPFMDFAKSLKAIIDGLEASDSKKLSDFVNQLKNIVDTAKEFDELENFNKFSLSMHRFAKAIDLFSYISLDYDLAVFSRAQKFNEYAKEYEATDPFNKFALGIQKFSYGLKALKDINVDSTLEKFEQLNKIKLDFLEVPESLNNFSVSMQRLGNGLKWLEKVNLEKINGVFESLKKIDFKDLEFEKISELAGALKFLDRGSKNITSGLNNSIGNLNNVLNRSTNIFNELGASFNNLFYFGFRQAMNWAKEIYNLCNKSIKEFSSYFSQEIKLKLVLDNKSLEGFFDDIEDVAKEISKKNILPQTGMIAAAAEFARYFKDAEAIKKLLRVLPDYAYGMSDGIKNLTPSELKNYARDLAKMSNEMYFQMTRRGFKITESQKNILKGTATEIELVKELGANYKNLTDDMIKAEVIQDIVANNWGGLADAINKTLQSLADSIKQTLEGYKIDFGEEISGGWSLMLNTLKERIDALKDTPKKLGKIFNDAFIAVNDFFFSPVTKALFDFGEDFFNCFHGLENIVAMSASFLCAAFGTALALVHNVLDEIKSFGITVGLVLKTVFLDITYQFGNVIKIILNSFTWGINGIIFSVNLLIDKLRDIPIFSKIMPKKNIGYLNYFEYKNSKALWGQLINDLKKADISLDPRTGFSTKQFNLAEVWNYLADSTQKYFESRRQEKTDIKNIKGNYTGDGYDEEDENVLKGIKDDTGKIANTISDDFAWLREFAEQEAINKFTTSEIKIEMTNNNNVNSELDLDGITNELTEQLRDAINRTVNGFYSY